MRFTNYTDVCICFTKEVLEIFEAHKQLSTRSLESGGQLFARFSDSEIVISKATGLREGDKRGRFSFWPNRRKEQDEITNLFADCYHYIGDWHTHPESTPTPSRIDLQNIAECYSQSIHDLNYFIMVIVGTNDFPEGLYVSAHDSEKSIELNFIPNLVGNNS